MCLVIGGLRFVCDIGSFSVYAALLLVCFVFQFSVMSLFQHQLGLTDLPLSLFAPDGSFPTHALKIRPPWTRFILSGAKTWEIRGNSCPHLGLIVLYKVGCKRIVGMVRIVESKLLQDDDPEAAGLRDEAE